MAHDAAAEIREDVGRRGRLGEYVGGIELAFELAKRQVPSSASLMHEVNAQINVLRALAAANRTFRPGNARLVVSKDLSQHSLGRKQRLAKNLRRYITS